MTGSYKTSSGKAIVMNRLDRIEIKRKTGKEPFHSSGRDAGFDLLGYWQWTESDLVSNTTRGIIAEYIVAQALSENYLGGEKVHKYHCPQLSNRSPGW